MFIVLPYDFGFSTKIVKYKKSWKDTRYRVYIFSLALFHTEAYL